MSSDFLNSVKRLRANLVGLRVITCDMKHENLHREGEQTFRQAICPARARSSNIACSHTSARLKLRDAWLLLNKLGDPEAVAQLMELSRVDGEIAVLDHRRYDAEAAGRDDIVADCIARHRALGAEMEALRQAALNALDRTSERLQLNIAS
jgi:hypothetical protein